MSRRQAPSVAQRQDRTTKPSKAREMHGLRHQLLAIWRLLNLDRLYWLGIPRTRRPAMYQAGLGRRAAEAADGSRARTALLLLLRLLVPKRRSDTRERNGGAWKIWDLVCADHSSPGRGGGSGLTVSYRL